MWNTCLCTAITVAGNIESMRLEMKFSFECKESNLSDRRHLIKDGDKRMV
jgi:hypothetical protein